METESEDATVVVTAATGPDQMGASQTVVVSREELLLLAEREVAAACRASAAADRSSQGTQLESPEELAALRERDLAAARVASRTLPADEGAEPEARTGAASALETRFFEHRVRSGRGRRSRPATVTAGAFLPATMNSPSPRKKVSAAIICVRSFRRRSNSKATKPPI